METDRLKYFCAIVETGSMAKASELLGVSNSGLSKAIATLQHELDTQLFQAKGRGLEVTTDGKRIYKKSVEMLSLLGDLRSHKNKQKIKIRIGLSEMFSHTMAGAIALAINAEVELLELKSSEIELCLVEEKIDFAFTSVPYPHREVEYLKIARTSLASYIRKDAFSKVAPEDVPYILPSWHLSNNPLGLMSRDGWNHKLGRTAGAWAGSLAIALDVVRAGAAAVYIPRFLAKHLNQSLPAHLQFEELEMSAKRKSEEVTQVDIFLAKLQSDNESLEMKKASNAVRKIVRIP